MFTPVNPFYYIKVGFKGVKQILKIFTKIFIVSSKNILGKISIVGYDVAL